MQLAQDFPDQITLAKSLLKRILNNFISNALKHTRNGVVTLSFDVISLEQLKELES